MISLFFGIIFCSAVAAHSSAGASSTELVLTEFDIEGDEVFQREVLEILRELHNLRIPFSSGLLIQLGLWRDWDIGKDLLEKLNELLRYRNKRLRIRKAGSEDGTLFDCRSFSININTKKRSKVPCLILPVDSAEQKYRIGSSENPICITVGHEFIHAIHSLEDRSTEECGEDYRLHLRLDAGDEKFWPSFTSSYRRGWGVLCANLEEQRTVLGTSNPSRDEFSEFWLRLAYGLFPRYMYQDAAQHFLENKECIDRIMERLIGINWEIRILRHCNAINRTMQYEFNPPASEVLVVDGSGSSSQTRQELEREELLERQRLHRAEDFGRKALARDEERERKRTGKK